MKNSKAIWAWLIFTFLLIHQSKGQELEPLIDPSKQAYYDLYVSKQKRLKKTGFILSSAGLASLGIGYALAYNSTLDDMEPGMALMSVGLISTTASIPIFIIAGSNKRKAKALLQTGRHQIMDLNNTGSRYVSLGVKIDL